MPVRDSLLELSSVELRRRIGSKEISPVELMEASIARMEALNPSVNAICATAYTRARREAKAAEKAALAGERLGPLHGLPTVGRHRQPLRPAAQRRGIVRGLGGSARLPFGLQVTGRFRGDLEVLDAAEAMEDAFTRIPGLGRPRPDLDRLAAARVDLKSLVTHPPTLPA